MSLKERSLNYIRKAYPAFTNGGRLEELALQAGYKSSNVSRRLRELENEGLLEKRMHKGRYANSVEYRAVPPFSFYRGAQKIIIS